MATAYIYHGIYIVETRASIRTKHVVSCTVERASKDRPKEIMKRRKGGEIRK
jgi:hypothetical protein